MLVRMPVTLRDQLAQDKVMATLKLDARQTAMIADIQAKMDTLAKEKPELAGAWGMGCGGTTC
jgi:hypothetical protein